MISVKNRFFDPRSGFRLHSGNHSLLGRPFARKGLPRRLRHEARDLPQLHPLLRRDFRHEVSSALTQGIAQCTGRTLPPRYTG